eukprot:SAG22_NODE_2646_length_2339_cov_6.228571_3_plen_320_part_00
MLEVGVFTGVATLGLALSVTAAAAAAQRASGQAPPVVVGLELEPKWPEVGRPYWRAAGVGHCIDLKIGPAADSLVALQRAVGASPAAGGGTGGGGASAAGGGDGGSKKRPSTKHSCAVELAEGQEAAAGDGFVELMVLADELGAARWKRVGDLHGKPHWRQAKKAGPADADADGRGGTGKAKRYHMYWAGPEQGAKPGWRLTKKNPAAHPGKSSVLAWRGSAPAPPRLASWRTAAGGWNDVQWQLTGFEAAAEEDDGTEQPAGSTEQAAPPTASEPGPAADGAAASKLFDLVFVDANKAQYELYYDAALELTRRGGAHM